MFIIKNSSSAVAASSSSSSCGGGLLLEGGGGGGIKNKKPRSIIFLSLSTTTPSIHRHRHGLIFKGSLSTARLDLPPPPPPHLWKRRADRFVLGVAAAAENVGDGGDEIADVEINNDNDALSSSSSSPSSSNTNTNTNTNSDILYIGVVLGCWYLFNIYFNIYNKQILEVFPFPLTISALQFGVGSLLIFVMWTTKLYKLPKISTSQLLAIIPLAVVHTFGNVFTNMSLGKVAVSFTHTVKAMEPFFSVFLSALFLGEVPSIWVLSSLVPVVGGVALASMTEVSFNWLGFWSAMASNLANQSRNVLSKKIMIRKEESLDNITLFSIMTIMSFFLSVPVALFVEGNRLNPSYIRSAGLNLTEVYSRSLLAAFCFHAYSQAGYMVLSRLSPVSHSVTNCVKRVVVIVSSVLFFSTPVSFINSLGTGIALAGVFLYSRVNKIKVKTS